MANHPRNHSWLIKPASPTSTLFINRTRGTRFILAHISRKREFAVYCEGVFRGAFPTRAQAVLQIEQLAS